MNAAEYFNGLSGKKVVLLGLGVSHRPLVPLLLRYGAKVTVCDKKTFSDLGEEAREYAQMGVEFSLGENYLSGLEGDILFKTPDMRADRPEILAFAERGGVVTSEMEVFFDLCPCPIIAVTGSDGKSTSTTLIFKFLEEEGFRCHLGGNIGRPLLPDIFDIFPDDYAVVELSSFQLHTMKKSPKIAVITNIAPNHLDWHTSMDEYVDSKKNIFRYQSSGCRLTLNADNRALDSFAGEARGELNFFSRKKAVDGAYCDEKGDIYLSGEEKPVFVMNRRSIILPGDHNLENYLTAAAATKGLVSPETIKNVAETFGGVQHRMEFVRELNGVKFYNDSIATSPTRTIACLKAQEEKIILIVGGYDKKIPYEPFAPYAVEKVKVMVVMGATGPKIEKVVVEHPDFDPEKLRILHAETMEDAVNQAYHAAKSGDKIYLSPVSASFDLYPNFEARGNHFKQIVEGLK